jgi:ribosomal protein L2
MYGSYGLYSGNRCNFSSSANLYKPAGVVSLSTSYQQINGVQTSNPTVSQTSTVISQASGTVSFEKNTNVLPSLQHIDYNQNPSPVVLSVRQTDNNKSIYLDPNGFQGFYKEQYVLPANANKTTTDTNPSSTTIYEQQNIVKSQ